MIYGLDGPGFMVGVCETECLFSIPFQTGHGVPPNLIYNGYAGSFVGKQRSERKLTTLNYVTPRLRTSKAIPPSPLCACMGFYGETFTGH